MGYASKGYVNSKLNAVKDDLKSLITSGAQYIGSWNAATNTPTITQGSGNNGDYYLVSTAGTWNGMEFKIGDTIQFSKKINKWERIATGKTEDKDVPMLVGFVDQTMTEFPTTRASGKPLIVGDYVKVKSGAIMPFTIESITFDSINDEAMHNGASWQEQSYAAGKTNEIKVDNPTEESIDGEGEYQNELNAKVADIIGKNKTLNVGDKDNIIDSLHYLSQIGIKVVTTMPTPSFKNENNTYFYIGEDTDDYISKTFYRCVEVKPVTDPKTYKYEEYIVKSDVFYDCIGLDEVTKPETQIIYRVDRGWILIGRAQIDTGEEILLKGYHIEDSSIIQINNSGLIINGTEYTWSELNDDILNEASSALTIITVDDTTRFTFKSKFEENYFDFVFVKNEFGLPTYYLPFYNRSLGYALYYYKNNKFVKVVSSDEGGNAKFKDLTDALKNNAWNKANGVFDQNHEVSLYELNNKRFLTCKFVFNNPLLDVTEPNKVLELPFSYEKPFKMFIGVHTHKGDKFYEGMRHDYFDQDGSKYINPADYEAMTVPIKDLKVESINNKLYAHQVIDAKGDLIYTNNFMSNVAPWLDYNEVEINAQTLTEVNRVVRPYRCLQRWVELELTTDPDHRYDKIAIPTLQTTGTGMQYRYMYFDADNQELYYGDERYTYKIGLEQDRSFNNIGDFYIATDTNKIYRYIQDLYETEKAQFKVNAEFMYNAALANANCRVLPDGKLARMTSVGNYDEDFCIMPQSFDGTYEWIPDDNYGTDTGGMADVIGNSIYMGGALDSINIGGGIL